MLKVILHLQQFCLSIRFSGSAATLRWICIQYSMYMCLSHNSHNAGISHESNLSSHKLSQWRGHSQTVTKYVYTQQTLCLVSAASFPLWGLEQDQATYMENKQIFWEDVCTVCICVCVIAHWGVCIGFCSFSLTGYCWQGMHWTLWSLANVTN